MTIQNIRGVYLPEPTSPLPSDANLIVIEEDTTADVVVRPWDLAVEVFARYFARECYGGRIAHLSSHMVLMTRYYDAWLLDRAAHRFLQDFPNAYVSIYDDSEEFLPEHASAKAFVLWERPEEALKRLTFVPKYFHRRRNPDLGGE